jgi:hypothetical protein
MFAPGSRTCAYKTASGLGKWPNRDPLEEDGGLNLYLVAGNNMITEIDILGLANGTKPKPGPPPAPNAPPPIGGLGIIQGTFITIK